MSSFSVSDVDAFGQDVHLDLGIMDKLPSGSRVVRTSRAGKSFSVETVRIEVKLPDGTKRVYYEKGAVGDVGLEMMRGAFESETAVHSFIPEYVPKPVAYGSYKDRPDVHFYIADYVDMDDVHPEPEAWVTMLSTLHKRSMGKSPEGKFGFHVKGYLANVPIGNAWQDSWVAFWSQHMMSLCQVEEERCGPDTDFAPLKKVFFEQVIPRYLGPLETDGRSVQPCLIHNDLWPRNGKPKTDDPDTLCAFDSACFWGHNEADLAVTMSNVWGLEKAGEVYRDIVGVSEPQDDFSARVEIYAMAGLVLRSAMYSKEPEHRNMYIQGMQALVDKAILAPAL